MMIDGDVVTSKLVDDLKNKSTNYDLKVIYKNKTKPTLCTKIIEHEFKINSQMFFFAESKRDWHFIALSEISEIIVNNIV